MPRTIIVHIGRNKTGTSSLQRALAASRPRLDELGFVYPRPGVNHNFLASYFRHKRRPVADQELAAMLDRRSARVRRLLKAQRKDVILSSEALQTARPKQVAEWVGDLGAVKIVVYLREQLDWLASFYQQAVKARLVTKSIEEFAEDYDPDYLAAIEPWEQEFGRDAMVVRVYDRERLVHGDVVADFLSVLGLAPDALASVTDDANPSIGGALLEAKRRLNGLGIDEAVLRGATYAPLRQLVTLYPEYRSKPGIPTGFAARYRARYAASNAAVAERYFEGRPLFRLGAPATGDEIGDAEIGTATRRLLALLDESEPALAADIRSRTARQGSLAS